MLATAVNPSVSLFFPGTTFPDKSRKFPCSEGIPAGTSRLRCHSLHSVSGIEEHQRVGPDVFSAPRGRARARTRGAGPEPTALRAAKRAGRPMLYARRVTGSN